MFAVTATSLDPANPLGGLTLGDAPDTVVPDGWVRVHMRAASLNHHDLWSLRGVGLPAERLPMILGCDAAGVLDDGTAVVVHGVIGDPAELAGPAEELLPVDIRVPGCPPTPTAIAEALLGALDLVRRPLREDER